MRALLLFVIGLVFGTTGGFLLGGGMGDSRHDHAGHGDMAHDHSALTVWEGTPPTLELIATPDIKGAANLEMQINGFTFTPDTVNEVPVQGGGHAHVYVNGKKVGRAYSPWMHLPDVPKGAIVRVTLNANDHTGWVYDGKPLAAEVTFE